MRVVILGNITEADMGVSNRTSASYLIDLTYRVQGLVMEVDDNDQGGWYIPASNVRSRNPVERLPWVSAEMFVLYDDFFSESPTQEEIDNFNMIYGFIPSLIEL